MEEKTENNFLFKKNDNIFNGRMQFLHFWETKLIFSFCLICEREYL